MEDVNGNCVAHRGPQDAVHQEEGKVDDDAPPDAEVRPYHPSAASVNGPSLTPLLHTPALEPVRLIVTSTAMVGHSYSMTCRDILHNEGGFECGCEEDCRVYRCSYCPLPDRLTVLKHGRVGKRREYNPEHDLRGYEPRMLDTAHSLCP